MVSDRQRARAFIDKALADEVDVEDFHLEWPVSKDPLVRAIGEETEDTIEHRIAPFLGRRKGSEFQRSVPYKILVVDRELLTDEFARVPSGELLDLRGKFLAEADLTQDDASLRVAVRAAIEESVS